MRYKLLEWQFYPKWYGPWVHREYDTDYQAEIVWCGFAFWQFRLAKVYTAP